MSAHWRLTCDVVWACIAASGSSGAAQPTPRLDVARWASCIGSGDERAGDVFALAWPESRQ